MKKKPKSKTKAKTKVRPDRHGQIADRPNTYKTRCDNHPDRRANYAFTDGATGERVGLCTDCYEEDTARALRRLRIAKVRARKAKKAKK